MNPGRSTILVVPCYNEATRLPSQTFGDYAIAHPDVSFLFVNDGSTDETAAVIDTLADTSDRIHALHLDTNVGKAEAVRQGMLWCSEKPYDLAGYWDADLSTSLDELPAISAPLNASESVDIVTAARIKMVGRRIERNPLRHYTGRAFATAVSVLFGIEMYDTQCGAKLFRNTPTMRSLFSDPFTTRWVFDVELFVRFSRCADKSIENNLVEVPLTEWRDVAGSKMRLLDFFKAPLELLRIHFTYYS